MPQDAAGEDEDDALPVLVAAACNNVWYHFYQGVSKQSASTPRWRCARIHGPFYWVMHDAGAFTSVQLTLLVIGTWALGYMDRFIGWCVMLECSLNINGYWYLSARESLQLCARLHPPEVSFNVAFLNSWIVSVNIRIEWAVQTQKDWQTLRLRGRH